MRELTREDFGRLVMYMPGEGPPDRGEPYDVDGPFDADELLEGLTAEERQMPARASR